MSGTAAASLPRRRNTREVEAFLVRMHRQGGQEAKSNSTGLRAFATGGPVVGRPRCSRTFLTEARSVRKASTVMRPPQRSQCSTSKRKTRSSNSAQGIRVGAFMAAGAAVREGTVAAGALEACGAAGSRDGTTSLRPAALGANTPCYAHLETMLSH